MYIYVYIYIYMYIYARDRLLEAPQVDLLHLPRPQVTSRPICTCIFDVQPNSYPTLNPTTPK